MMKLLLLKLPFFQLFRIKPLILLIAIKMKNSVKIYSQNLSSICFTAGLLFFFGLVSFNSLAHASSGVGNVFGVLMGKSGSLSSENSIDDVLVRISAQINRTLPANVDSETRLDSVSAVPGRHFIYSYTLVSVSSADINVDDFHRVIKPQLKTRLCASTEMQNFLKNGVTISYLYKGKDGNPIGGAKFAPSECSDKR